MRLDVDADGAYAMLVNRSDASRFEEKPATSQRFGRDEEDPNSMRGEYCLADLR